MIICGYPGGITDTSIKYNDEYCTNLTPICRDYEVYSFDVNDEYNELEKIINANKAREQLIIISKMYTCPVLTKQHRNIIYNRRMMFSKSGFLPKRIHKIKT